ncbi:vitamin K epoxide reductase family protein [Mucilaginibacter sabulilitoris]|uniref:Vitamin K epoxide reductase family protein n=1 Tax=Mucilaginibacter sabulilitoris TaxID=1173583 RepID=A0ABZ0TQN3_9SPHI|nr:vitamin K epoxide reductase family protein [Mucilaginibacter sabulilitoris]WPU95217.1 vitamin K epoxide reductase family protein [Mucilaginibacter sabulilitoris]
MKNYLNKLLEPKQNGAEITSLLVKLLNVKISDGSIKKDLEQHPDYPSLLSISDILTHYGIENLSVKVNRSKIIAVPVPFITQLKGTGRKLDFFTIVKEISIDTIQFFDPESHRWQVSLIDAFLERCSGVVLLTEVGQAAGEKDYVQKIKSENRQKRVQNLTALCIPAMLLITGIIAFIHKGTTVLFPLVFSVLTLVGGILSILLLWFELDQYNPTLQQICSAGKKINCGAVLNSKGAKIAGISWSSIGLSYFIGELLFLMLGGLSNPYALFLLSWLNALALPYIFYSIYYQWQVAKQWCVLCLCVQGLLALQFATALAGNWHILFRLETIPPELYLQLITSFSVPFIMISILYPALLKAKERNGINTELQQLKHNPQVFEALLTKQKVLEESPTGLGIILGNPNATYKIIKVCNPYCGPCAKAHTPMEELLHNNPDIQIQIIFTAKNDEHDKAAAPVKHLLAIAENSNQIKTQLALDDWYLAEKKDYKNFATQYPMNGELKNQGNKIDAMRAWCNKTEIKFTPTFFVSIPFQNEQSTPFYQLPSTYQVEDLKYFLSV